MAKTADAEPKRKPTRAETLKAVGDALNAAVAAVNQGQADGVRIRELDTIAALLSSAVVILRLVQARATPALRALLG